MKNNKKQSNRFKSADFVDEYKDVPINHRISSQQILWLLGEINKDHLFSNLKDPNNLLFIDFIADIPLAEQFSNIIASLYVNDLGEDDKISLSDTAKMISSFYANSLDLQRIYNSYITTSKTELRQSIIAPHFSLPGDSVYAVELIQKINNINC